MWVFLSAAYGLIIANAKKKVIGDSILTKLGFRISPLLSQLFVLFLSTQTFSIAAKIVNEFLLARVPAVLDPIVLSISEMVDLITITHIRGHLCYFGITLHQAEYYTTVFDGFDKLSVIGSMPLSRIRHRGIYAPILAVGFRVFGSRNLTLGWLGTPSPSPLRVCIQFYARQAHITPWNVY